MLYEQIQYEYNLPFYATFSNVACEDYHKHKEMEIMLVLRGHACCTIHHLEYEVKQGDILIVDTQDLHRIHDSSRDLIMLTIYIDIEKFTDKYPNVDYTVFTCEDCTKDSVEKYQELQNKTSLLKSQMARIMFSVKNEPANYRLLEGYMDEFISVLVEQFQGFFIEDMKFKANQGKTRGINLERLYRIVKYIYQNYDKNITLNDVAELEHLSRYYVSHLIKDSTGLSFQNFVNYIRVEYAEEHLVEGELTLTEISEFCGFSSPAYFNKCFKKWHGVTPSAYKKNLKRYQRSHADSFSEDEAMRLLSSHMNDYKRISDSLIDEAVESEMLLNEIMSLTRNLNEQEKKNVLSYVKFLEHQQS